MYNPDSGSSQHASSKEDPENSILFPIGHPCYFDPEVMATKMLGKRWRKADAGIFRHEYLFSDDSSECKTCIWSDGTFSWDDKSSGIMWVGVLGKDTICVVTMTGDVDMTRTCGSFRWCTKESVLREFRKLVISEIEDLEGRVGFMYQMAGKYTKMPFSVVSVIRRTNEVDKESGHEKDQQSKRYINIFNVEISSHQLIEASAATFASAKLGDGDKDSVVLAYASAGILQVFSVQDGTSKSARLTMGDIDDFPISIEVSRKYNWIYIISHSGILHIYDLKKIVLIFRGKISDDPII